MKRKTKTKGRIAGPYILRLALIFLFLPLTLHLQSCSRLFKYSAVETYSRAWDGEPVDTQGPPSIQDSRRYPEESIRRSLAEMKKSGDPVLNDLAGALSKLPDLNVNVGPETALAVEKIRLIALQADEEQRSTIWRLAVENTADYHFSGSLQGLLWMVEDGAFEPELLSTGDRADFLEYAWNRLPGMLTSPEIILEFMAANFSYILNASTAEPLESFFQDKYGDCTEFCLFEGYFLEKLGYETWVIVCLPTDIMAHASIIYKDARGYWLLDGSRIVMHRILKQKMSVSELNLFDKSVWIHMRPFDRIFGPSQTIGDLVGIYEKIKNGKVPYKLIPYGEFKDFIDVWGREKPSWFYFK